MKESKGKKGETQRKSKPRDGVKGKKSKKKGEKSKKKGEKFDAKLLALALIFIMLFVSFVVIFSSETPSRSQKKMVFEYVGASQSTREGHTEGINLDLSTVELRIKDSSSDVKNSTENLVHGLTLDTGGGFNCTYFDQNGNNKVDDGDKFMVYKASTGDYVKLILKSTGEEVAYYIF